MFAKILQEKYETGRGKKRTISVVEGGDNSSKLEFQVWHLGADSLHDFKVFCLFRKKIR